MWFERRWNRVLYRERVYGIPSEKEVVITELGGDCKHECEHIRVLAEDGII